ncbi:MAG: DEAD/DEAH box helicase [Vitreoscilla sp.]|nr:DEAD/DEAH box helicase [Vitreoscilla sp.]
MPAVTMAAHPCPPAIVPDQNFDTKLNALNPLDRAVLLAFALGALPRARSWVYELLYDPQMRPGVDKRPVQDAIRLSMQSLKQRGWLLEDLRRPGYWSPSVEVLAGAWQGLLMAHDTESLRGVLARVDGYPGPDRLLTAYRYFPSFEAMVARLRLEALSGASVDNLRSLIERQPWSSYGLADILDVLLPPLLDLAPFARLHPTLRIDRACRDLQQAMVNFNEVATPKMAERALLLLAQDLEPRGFELRWLLAEYLSLTDQSAEVDPLLAPVLNHQPLAAEAHAHGLARQLAVQAAVLAWRGHWAAAEAAGDEALARLRKLTGKRRGLVPLYLSLPYALALLAQRTPAHLAKALKFCLGEGGKREPVLESPHGYIALAIRMKLGEVPRDPLPFKPYLVRDGHYLSPLDPWRWLMRAWLKEGAQAEPLTAPEAEAAGRLKAALTAMGWTVLAGQLDAAMQVLGGEGSPPHFFVPAGEERWQSALSALAAITAPAGPVAGGDATRLLWLVSLGPQGQVQGVLPFEQKQGARGWSKPKEVPLSRLQKTSAALAAHDTKVAVCIKQESYSRNLRIDLASAMLALVGHPCVAFADQPEQLVELSQASPELEVLREGSMLRVRMRPAMHVAKDEAQFGWGASAAELKEQEALRLITVLRDGPQRAQLIQLNPAQKRAAQLLGVNGLDIPERGAAQLQQVLTGLGTHFRIQADDAAAANAAREVPAESRLRAELQPVGDGLQLRLVAFPYGMDYAEGPRLPPASGRARLVTLLRNEQLGVQRDLAAERASLEAVLDACPMLMEPPPGAPCEWQIDEPELALALVERLHTLNAVAALDWPQGRPVRVTPGAIGQLSLKVQTKQDWLGLQGELKVDEELVVSLQQLLGWASTHKSRFMPLGDGRYLALTQELRERMDDIAAVTESHAQRGHSLADLRVPVLAAPWLQQATEGAQVDFDAGFTNRLQLLDDARRIVPAVPATLQATLRPYQEEGYEWAMRLAHAGLGACLADDMGLGKTLQSLAVLLARARLGPALIVAPTSLLGNWRAEAARFAPSLKVHIYAEGGAPGERTERLAKMKKQEVVLVSYPMLLNDGAAFAAREWATLVLDEAQAIKNAAAKRSQAVYELRAGFRLALSGTPIENRLAELWSVMNACNPGLLGTAHRFGERFVALIERQKDRHAQRTLRRLIAPFILRRTKAQVLDDLPPRTELVLRIPASDQEAAHYEALRRETLIEAEKALNGDAAGQAQLNILAGLTRLRRAACDPRLVSPELKMPGAKVQAFAELAAELVANGHKALVFSQFVDFLSLLREPLDAASIAYQYLDGSTPSNERTKRVDAFQAGEGDLFLISLKAGGFGLNLTVADYVVIADPWWNPAAEDQASGRAHRIGQQRPVTVYRLVREGTLEERIITLHQSKRELADSILDGEGIRTAPAPAELLALMRGDDAFAQSFE